MFLSHFAVVLLRHFVTGFRVQSLLTAGKKEQEDVNPCRNKTVVGCLVKFFVDFWHGVITFSPVFCFKGNVFKESHTVNFVENPQQCLQKKKVISVYTLYIYVYIMDVMFLFVGGRKSQLKQYTTDGMIHVHMIYIYIHWPFII